MDSVLIFQDGDQGSIPSISRIKFSYLSSLVLPQPHINMYQTTLRKFWEEKDEGGNWHKEQ